MDSLYNEWNTFLNQEESCLAKLSAQLDSF